MCTRLSFSVLVALSGCAEAPSPRPSFPGIALLPDRAALPNPLEMVDGRKITSAGQWERERRPELKALFQHYMYGYLPPPPGNVRGKIHRADVSFFGGKATKKEVTVTFGPPGCPPLELLLVVPNRRPGPAPVFLGLNFTGNHSLVADASVAVPKTWMREGPDVVEHRATEAGRGTKIDTWALEQSIDRGYAVATFCYGDALPDKPDFRDGVYPYFLRPGLAAPEPDDWGAIACWAWALHRAVDYLVTDPDVDPARIAVTGHSRNGKAALVAAAFDERIALVIPHQAGCGGTAPSRTRNPKAETVKAINDRFPHWFNDVFPSFNDAAGRLPFDQHCLVALVAPRPVLFTNGIEDQWADPEGQFEMLRAADPVYRLLGAGGLDEKELPPLGRLVDSRLGYYLRSGGHVSDPEYWKVFLDYADWHLKR
jgi:cephalosporin-C deacetylase-like acetyl esterase